MLPGKLLDRDYRHMAARCGQAVNLRSGDDIATFPIEKARLRSIWYLVFISSSATVVYGWVLHARTVRLAPISINKFCFMNLTIRSIFQFPWRCSSLPDLASQAYLR